VGFPDRQGRGAPGGMDIGFTPSEGLGQLCSQSNLSISTHSSALVRRIVSFANEILCGGSHRYKKESEPP
jgi:hypothetical protein